MLREVEQLSCTLVLGEVAKLILDLKTETGKGLLGDMQR